MLRLKSRLKNTVRKFRFFFKRPRPLPRQVRTSKNPVRVVFVCPFGGSSNALSNAFSAALKKRGITSVVSTSFSSKGKNASELRKRMANADFVITRSNMMISNRRFKDVVPVGSQVLHSYPSKIIANSSSDVQVLRPMTLDVERETERILKAIGRRFEFKS